MEPQTKIALVTGASRGIGKAIALSLAREGYMTLGTATTESGSAAISTYFAEHQLAGVGQVLDISEKGRIPELIDRIKAEWGSIDILINNAATTRDNLMLRMKDEEWQNVINTNLNGVFYLTRTCLRDMIKKRWGRIINITSIVGVTGNAGQANYSAAKAGLIGLTKSIALEVATRHITVNAIAPGYVETDMTAALSDEQKAAILSAVPMKRGAKPEEIAALVAFLASDQASYITGQTIHINGGMLML